MSWRTARRWPAVVVLLLALMAGCSGDAEDDAAAEPVVTTTSTAATSTTEVTTTTSTEPTEVEPEPGALLSATDREGELPEGSRAWDVRYSSTDVGGNPVEVTGVVYAPTAPAPEGGRPVLSWAHGTTGVADVCAPSRSAVIVPYLERFLAAGYVVAATDYQGLGTPGTHHYLVGGSEGRSVLDAARAASLVEDAGASTDVVVFGHSQGGHAALFAGELAPSYAPELELAGVVAAAPPTELQALLAGSGAIPQFFGFLASSSFAYAEAYPELDLADVLTPAALDQVGLVEEVCLGEVLAAYAGRPVADWVETSALDLPDWRARVAENEPGAVPIEAPVLVIQGTADPIVPASTVDTGVTRLCGSGTAIDYRRYEGADHASVLASAADDVVGWVADRLAGEPATPTCGR